MSEYSQIIGIIDIKCPKCENDKSYQRIWFDNSSEFGECTSCGALTYSKQTKTIHTFYPTVKCPYCNSTNTKKISGVSKAAKVATFGIFALPKASKEWHCNNCKSDF